MTYRRKVEEPKVWPFYRQNTFQKQLSRAHEIASEIVAEMKGGGFPSIQFDMQSFERDSVTLYIHNTIGTVSEKAVLTVGNYLVLEGGEFAAYEYSHFHRVFTEAPEVAEK